MRKSVKVGGGKVASRVWKSITVKGRAALRSPDGRIYFGTRGEVASAGLSPWRRRSLCEALRSMHKAYAEGDGIPGDVFREGASRLRRDAIREGGYDLLMPHSVVSCSLEDSVRIGAAARVAGVSVRDFVLDWVLAGVEAAADDCGGRLPFTRQELAALARCR